MKSTIYYLILLLIIVSSCATFQKTAQYKDDVVNVVNTLYKQVEKENKNRYALDKKTYVFVEKNLEDVIHVLLYEKQIDSSYFVSFHVRDENVKSYFFNKKAYNYQKKQLKEAENFPMELFPKNNILLIRDKCEKTPIDGRTFVMTFPVFTKDGRYAIYSAMIAPINFSGIMIDRKDKNGNWENYKTFDATSERKNWKD